MNELVGQAHAAALGLRRMTRRRYPSTKYRLLEPRDSRADNRDRKPRRKYRQLTCCVMVVCWHLLMLRGGFIHNLPPE